MRASRSAVEIAGWLAGRELHVRVTHLSSANLFRQSDMLTGSEPNACGALDAGFDRRSAVKSLNEADGDDSMKKDRVLAASCLLQLFFRKMRSGGWILAGLR